MSKRAVSILVLAIALVGLLVIVPEVPLLVFGGILLAVFLRGGGDWIAKRLGDIDPRIGVGIFMLLVAGALAGAGALAAPAAASQLDELFRRLPEAFERVKSHFEDTEWGENLLERLEPGAIASSAGGRATSAVTATFGALGNLVLVLFVGLYLALAPWRYRQGFAHLLAPSIRPRAEEVLDKAATTLRRWLGAQLISMTVVGVLTWFGLWILGVPLAFILGLIAGLLAFIPMIGPIAAAVPAVILAFAEGWSTVLWVMAVYVTVQTIESYAITPMVQQHSVSIPPALVILSLLLFGALFGFIGLILATPLAAVGMTLTRLLYVEDYLERRAEPDSEPRES